MTLTATKKEFVLGSSDVTWDFTTTEFTGDRIDNELNELMCKTYELARKRHLYVACNARLELQGSTDSSLIVTTWTIHANVYTVQGEHLKDIWATSKYHERATELVLQRLDNFIGGYRTGKPVPKRVVNAQAKMKAEHVAAPEAAADGSTTGPNNPKPKKGNNDMKPEEHNSNDGHIWLSPEKAAAYLGIAPKVLGLWKSKTDLQGKQVGMPFKIVTVDGTDYRVYNRADLDAFIAGNYSDPVTGKRVEGTSHMTFSGTSPTAGGAK